MSKYDAIADTYDAMFSDEKSLAEDAELREKLAPYVREGKKVLDIGCGTGLLLRMFPGIGRDRYWGIDPSRKMLEQFADQHPEYITKCQPFDMWSLEGCDVAVAMYAVGSYLSVEHVRFIMSKAPSFFLMFYADETLHEIYERAPSLVLDYRPFWAFELGKVRCQRCPGFVVEKWHDFMIVRSEPG